jgi:hypothetical protein
VWSTVRYVGGWSPLNSGNEVVCFLSRALVSTTSSLLLLFSFSENGAKSELDLYVFGNWGMAVCMKTGCPVFENVISLLCLKHM